MQSVLPWNVATKFEQYYKNGMGCFIINNTQIPIRPLDSVQARNALFLHNVRGHLRHKKGMGKAKVQHIEIRH